MVNPQESGPGIVLLSCSLGQDNSSSPGARQSSHDKCLSFPLSVCLDWVFGGNGNIFTSVSGRYNALSPIELILSEVKLICICSESQWAVSELIDMHIYPDSQASLKQFKSSTGCTPRLISFRRHGYNTERNFVSLTKHPTMCSIYQRGARYL